MKEEIKIIRSTTTDVLLIANLSSVTFADTFRGTCTDEDLQGFIKENFNETQVYKELQDQSDFYFIAFVNEKAVGYIRMKTGISDIEFINKLRAIEIKRIYVLKEYHSQKAGAALMNFALQFASKNGYEIIWLGVWEHNIKAKNFYKKFGFIDSGIMHEFPIGNTPQKDNSLYKFIEKR